jgi:hypothetical protein
VSYEINPSKAQERLESKGKSGANAKAPQALFAF